MNKYEVQLIILAGALSGIIALILFSIWLAPYAQSFYTTLDRLWL